MSRLRSGTAPRLTALPLLAVAFLLVLAPGCRDRDGSDPGTTPASTAEASASSNDGGTPSADGSEGPASPTPEARPAIEAGTHERTFEHAGDKRSYLLRVPPGYDGSTPLPVVLAFHGGGGNAENAVRMTAFDEAADRHGFFAVFPDGSGRLDGRLLTWNAGNCCGYARDNSVDDVAFTRALVEDLDTLVAIDRSRIFVTGMSNGGMLSYVLACRAADLIAAAAPVAGALNIEDCAPSEPVALAAFHGTADQHVRYEGGPPEVRVDRAERVDTSVADSVGAFVAANGCDHAPAVEATAWGHLETWPGCAPGGAVALYTVEGGGHAWPGGRPGTILGDRPTTLLSATEAMWAFFEAHPKP